MRLRTHRHLRRQRPAHCGLNRRQRAGVSHVIGAYVGVGRRCLTVWFQ